jgi:hypothetical protein
MKRLLACWALVATVVACGPVETSDTESGPVETEVTSRAITTYAYTPWLVNQPVLVYIGSVFSGGAWNTYAYYQRKSDGACGGVLLQSGQKFSYKSEVNASLGDDDIIVVGSGSATLVCSGGNVTIYPLAFDQVSNTGWIKIYGNDGSDKIQCSGSMSGGSGICEALGNAGNDIMKNVPPSSGWLNVWMDGGTGSDNITGVQILGQITITGGDDVDCVQNTGGTGLLSTNCGGSTDNYYDGSNVWDGVSCENLLWGPYCTTF